MQQYFWLQSSSNQAESPLATLPQPTETELETLRRQHELILNSVGEGVYGLDLDGRVTFVNPAAANMIGWAIPDLLGQPMHAVLHHSKPNGSPYPAHECPIYEAFRDGRIHRSNTEVFWRKDGSNFPVEFISSPMQDQQGKVVGTVVAFQDITQRKWAETLLQRTNEELELKVRDRTAALQQSNEELQELSELKSRFVAMVCHEFRNPLNNILLSASSLDRYDSQMSPDQRRDYLKGVKIDVERMTRMIDDILAIGKIEAHKLMIQPAPLELVQFCHSLVAEMQLLANQQSLTVTSRHRQLIAELDEKLLRSILTNILSNSIRYSRNQSPIHLRLSKRNSQAIFQISDRGIGIPPEDLPHLFDLFHRGKNVSNISGTGLGLNIVKRFVDLHNGQIRVESKLNIGTTFTITLPLFP
ncbi:PAS domain-containing sensor histidine kinase [Gloeocapsa sp. PCC 73106]|uniref:PAS domain-containing sensor histidine kinase n=1 Tax=Gloeocapsa sp. PCC 73106 TaxID=102232 RepID=UPI0002ACE624|nr:PAS domain-containing sensor histidine kinase [Gloeocapsa sp. PCC 73106]ELR96522.1 PAS domain S-box [Gloeocapsa sp. PCC 73106]